MALLLFASVIPQWSLRCGTAPRSVRPLANSKALGEDEEKEKEGEVVGFLLVYVDDLMILQAQWETSTPEQVGEEKVKLLGIPELMKVGSGHHKKTTSRIRRGVLKERE